MKTKLRVVKNSKNVAQVLDGHLTKNDWIEITTIYNIFGKSDKRNDWNSIQDSPVRVIDILNALTEARKVATSITYISYINEIIDLIQHN